MPSKGYIKPDIFTKSKYWLIIPGMIGVNGPELTVLSVGALEEEMEVIELPDRTRATNGHTKPLTFDVVTPAHHLEEQAQWELWWSACHDPVSFDAYRYGTLVQQSVSGGSTRSITLDRLFITKKSTSDLEMSNDSDYSTVTWTLSADNAFPV